jgi:hypothetical protein
MKTKTSLNHGTPPDAKHLLGEVLPCSECGNKPDIDEDEVGFIIACKNGCYEKYEADMENIGRWFQTFPWTKKEDAIDEWNTAVKCNNGVKQRRAF